MIALNSMETSSSLLHSGLQVFAVLQWVFSFLGLGESTELQDPGKSGDCALLPQYPKGGSTGTFGRAGAPKGLNAQNQGRAPGAWLPHMGSKCLPIPSPGVPDGLAPRCPGPGLDPSGPLPGLALHRQRHPQVWRPPLSLVPQLGCLETFPRLLSYHGDSPGNRVLGTAGRGFKIDS